MNHKFRLMPHQSPETVLASREIGVSKYCPWSHLVSSSVFATYDGALGSVISLKGLAFEVSGENELLHYQEVLSRFWQHLPESIAVYVTVHREKREAYPVGEFPEGLSADFNRDYKNRFAHKSMYVNNLYITLMSKADFDGIPQVAFLKKLFSKKNSEAQKYAERKAHQQLMQVVHEALSALHDFTPTLLGAGESAAVSKSSALLSFLHLLVSGEKREIVYPNPFTALNRYLPAKRISFGWDTIEFTGNHHNDRRFAAIMGVKAYQNMSETLGADKMLTADFSFISTHSFLRQPKDDVINEMNIRLNHLMDADDAAISQREDLEKARDGVASGLVGFGLHQHTLLIFADDPRSLEHHIAKASQWSSQAGLILIRESKFIRPLFFSQLPGNFKDCRRAVLLSSENFAGYAPLHNYHIGYKDENHLGSAVMMMESSGKTPVYFNWHKRSSLDNPGLGHTLILGPSGGGKTVLLSALETMTRKYRHRSILFDRDRGCEIFIRASGGFYSVIEPGVPTGFNPLQLEDTPANRQFLIYWFSSLLVGQGNLSPAAKVEVTNVINANYTLDKDKRRLSIIAQFLPADFPYHDNLSPWLEGGELAYLFDNPKDNLNLSRNTITGFDMTNLIGEGENDYSGSVFSYLFYRQQLSLDGTLTMCHMEESHQVLEHPFWVAWLKKKIPSYRKKNFAIVLSTQAPENILNSPLRPYLMSNTATFIFLPNSDAVYEVYVKGFNLTEGEYEWIKTIGDASHSFLFRQGSDVMPMKLNLTGCEKYLKIFSGNEASIQRAERLWNEVGYEPKNWLPLFMNEQETFK